MDTYGICPTSFRKAGGNRPYIRRARQVTTSRRVEDSALPDLRVVIDQAAKPNIASSALGAWPGDMSSVASETSDRPVLNLNRDYLGLISAAEQLIAELSHQEKEWMMGRTASDFYRLRP